MSQEGSWWRLRKEAAAFAWRHIRATSPDFYREARQITSVEDPPLLLRGTFVSPAISIEARLLPAA
jgi:hypothetical protein